MKYAISSIANLVVSESVIKSLVSPISLFRGHTLLGARGVYAVIHPSLLALQYSLNCYLVPKMSVRRHSSIALKRMRVMVRKPGHR